MLMPKKVKYRKQQRGRMRGKAWRGGTLAFGDYGLKVMEPGWVTDRQIEASRVAMTRFVKRGGTNCHSERAGVIASEETGSAALLPSKTEAARRNRRATEKKRTWIRKRSET